MVRKNLHEMTRSYNSVRLENQNKTFGSAEIHALLERIGLNKNIIGILVKKGIITSKPDVGRKRKYSFSREPLYEGDLKKCYDEFNVKAYQRKNELKKESSISVDDAWRKLIEEGIIKPRFNINTLKAKYPKIYLECLEYEIVTK